MSATHIFSNAPPQMGMPSRVGTRYVSVGQSASKQWIVKDNQGRLGAVFRSQKAAMRFARDEASTLHCCVVMSSSSVELECLLCG
jgi:hypothetical protein